MGGREGGMVGGWVGGMARMGKWISGMWGLRKGKGPPRQTEEFHFHQLWKVPYCLKQRAVDLQSIFVSQEKALPLPFVPKSAGNWMNSPH